MSGFLIGAIAGISAGAATVAGSYVIAWRYTKSRFASAVILNAIKMQLGIAVVVVVALIGAEAYIGFPAIDDHPLAAVCVFLVGAVVGSIVITSMTRYTRRRLPG